MCFFQIIGCEEVKMLSLTNKSSIRFRKVIVNNVPKVVITITPLQLFRFCFDSLFKYWNDKVIAPFPQVVSTLKVLLTLHIK